MPWNYTQRHTKNKCMHKMVKLRSVYSLVVSNVNHFSGFCNKLQVCKLSSLGEAGWCVHGTSLYYSCDSFWVNNSFKINSLCKGEESTPGRISYLFISTLCHPVAYRGKVRWTKSATSFSKPRSPLRLAREEYSLLEVTGGWAPQPGGLLFHFLVISN